ncbi:metal ABC transporter ATP-binding protein, partial [Photobacterium sanctipauli]
GAAKIGYVPQKATFESSLPLTVTDFILLNQTRHPLFWRQNSRHKKRAMDQLARLGMAERANRRMGQLSGGEQQRVLFAQALLDDPEFIVLDEPTTGMDEQGVKYLDALVQELLSEQRTLLAVHHDASAVQRLPTPLVHVVNRRILQSGPASELLEASNLATLFQHYTQSPKQEVA